MHYISHFIDCVVHHHIDINEHFEKDDLVKFNIFAIINKL